MARNAKRQSTRRIVVAEYHVGNGIATLFARIISREQGIGVLCCPIHVERSAFDIDNYEGFTCLFQRFE